MMTFPSDSLICYYRFELNCNILYLKKGNIIPHQSLTPYLKTKKKKNLNEHIF